MYIDLKVEAANKTHSENSELAITEGAYDITSINLPEDFCSWHPWKRATKSRKECGGGDYELQFSTMLELSKQELLISIQICTVDSLDQIEELHDEVKASMYQLKNDGQ